MSSQLQVTRGPVDLVTPFDSTPEAPLRYGIAMPFQVAPRKAAVLVNVRRLGVTPIDFEVGADAIVFDSLDGISADNAVTIARNYRGIHPQTGQPLALVEHISSGGFVPLGAKLADGRPHPHAGTGFIVASIAAFAADLSTRLNAELKPPYHYMVLYQLAFDGRALAVTRIDRFIHEPILPGVPVVGRGLGWAIPDGEDLLFGLVVREPGQKGRAGLGRWRRGEHGWRPISFVPITPLDTSGEPNIQRDIDGSLLFGARCGAHDEGEAVSFGIRVWRSTDGGRQWEQVVSAANTRASTPVILNQAADGTPYVTANPYRPEVRDGAGRTISVWSHRQQLLLWPLRDDRRGLLEPILVRDTADFGPAPQGRVWYIDHPVANTVQLADGQWHNLLTYRGRESQPTRNDAERATPSTGAYIEEVTSSSPAIPRWSF